MMYSMYTMEKIARETYNERIAEAKRYSKWATARKAIRELSKNIASR